MDALVREATAIYPGERTESVRRFLKDLDRIEEEITAPDAGAPEPDPLTAGKGDEIAGWTVERALGKGSTSRALLVTKDGGQRVFKVALTDAAARRLEREAQQLGQLTDSHVVRLLDPPFEAGPPDHRRTVIGVEYLQGDTLADELRRHGPLTIHELERLGEDLFQALKFLDGRGVWHRDIKPDNLALRPLERKGRELVLFDFSLAGTPDTELGVGTKDYLDPFLGTGRRDRYDQAAELYAVAVTLHEMASAELPSWGDDLVPSSFLGQDEQAQLAEDIFDPVLRDGLVEFFRTAFHRDAGQAVRLAPPDDPRLDRHLRRPGDGPAADHRVHRGHGRPSRPGRVRDYRADPRGRCGEGDRDHNPGSGRPITVRALHRPAAPRRLHRRRACPRPRQANHPAARHRQRPPVRAGPPFP